MKNKLFLVTILVCSLFLFVGCQNGDQNQVSVSENSSSEENQQIQNDQAKPSEEISNDWQIYKNEKYGYQIKYPNDWYFMEDACCPPPPASVNLNNFSSKRSEYSANQTKNEIYGIDILCLYEGSLDEIGEIQNLKDRGAKAENTTVNSHSAIKFAKNVVPGDNSEKAITYYIVDGQQGCRITYTDKCPVCEKITQTFQF